MTTVVIMQIQLAAELIFSFIFIFVFVLVSIFVFVFVFMHNVKASGYGCSYDAVIAIIPDSFSCIILLQPLLDL